MRDVTGFVVEGKVVLVQGVLAAVKVGLVSKGVGAVTNGGGHVHNGATITKHEYLVELKTANLYWTISCLVCFSPHNC